MLGCANIKPKYKFSNEHVLIEVARVLVSMGATTYKFSLTPSSVDIPVPSSVKTLRDVVAIIPEYKQVFDMPELKNYVCWAYSIGGSVVKDRFDDRDAALEYKQMYDLASHLLQTYTGTGKRFYLGNWETDWGAMGLKSFDDVDPPQRVIDNIVRYFTVRQKAVDDAKAALRGSFKDVEVFHYAEVVMVKEAMNNPLGRNARCVNAVIPRVPELDYVSWSAYTVQDDPKEETHRVLDYIESCMRPITKAGGPPTGQKRVFIGEFGWMHLDGMPCAQHQAAFLRNVFSWGCPMALFWQMYGGGANTYCLVRPNGTRNESYSLYCEYLKAATPNEYFFDDFLARSEADARFKRCRVHTLEAPQTFQETVVLQDETVIDLNGMMHECTKGIRNVGAKARIVNRNSQKATLVLRGVCTFGMFANNWFSGYKKGAGNAVLEGAIDVVVRGAGTVITFDAENTFTGDLVIESGTTFIAKAPGCLRDCRECRVYGTLIISAPDVFGDDTVLRIGKGTQQVVCNVTDTYVNHIIIEDGAIGVKGRGLIDVSGSSEVTFAGAMRIEGTPAFGGHFGGNIVVKGNLALPRDDIPMLIRRGVCTIMQPVSNISVLQGTLKIGAEMRLSRVLTSVNGNAFIDACGCDVVINDLKVAAAGGMKFACTLQNSSNSASATCIIENMNQNIVLFPGKLQQV